MVRRREFVRLCSSAVALVSISPRLLAQQGSVGQRYQRVRLTDNDGNPLKAANLQSGATYIFHYPFAGTPCFLIDLGKPTDGTTLKNASGETYQWPGGVGKQKSIVAFSAICSHQLSYVGKTQSFINYRHDQSKVAGRSQVIVCCAHHSVYDPVQGARVLAGPTPEPLATILLEHDVDKDELYATGTLGSDKFAEFFRAYKRQLIEEFGRGVSHEEVKDSTMVLPLSSYTQQEILC